MTDLFADGTISIHDADVKAIKEMIAHKGAHSERTPETHSVHTKDASVQSNNILIEQLREKDKQIEHLQKLLDQSQLSLNASHSTNDSYLKPS